MSETFRFRQTSSASRAHGDAWFIPYEKPKQGESSTSPYSIGQSPEPARHSSGNLLSYFSSPTSPSPYPENKSFRFPLSGSARADSPTRQRSHERGQSAGNSSSSLLDAVGRSRLSTSNSVPTGLSAPKLLFSPLSREIHGTTYMPAVSPTPTRQRTFSAPNRRRKFSNTYRDEPEPRQWATPTICDKLVFAKPHITPHYITPPGSPEDTEGDVFSAHAHRAVDDGRQRDKERDQWARYVKFRGRSRSFGNEAPRIDAPIIGNAKVRAAELERRESKRRSNSTGSKSRWIPRHRNTQSTSDLRPSFLHLESDKSVGVTTSFGFKKRTPSKDRSSSSSRSQTPRYDDFDIDPFARKLPYAGTHARTQSSPNLSTHDSPRVPRGPPPRTLRLQNPPIKKQGVIIIGAETDSEDSRRRAPPAPLDFGKPLPDLPQGMQDRPQDTNSTEPIDGEIGKAISPPMDHDETQPSSSMTPILPSPASARSFLAQQHARSRTLKAFKGPTSARSSLRSHVGDVSAATSAPRSGRLSTSTYSSSGSVGQRRPTALEEAIGRSRAASVSTLESKDNTTALALAERPHSLLIDGQPQAPRIVATSPSSTLDCGLTYPTVTDQSNTLTIPPLGPRKDSNFSQSSKNTVYTDASEGWSRTGSVTPSGRPMSSAEDTPSPEEEVSDRFNVRALRVNVR